MKKLASYTYIHNVQDFKGCRISYTVKNFILHNCNFTKCLCFITYFSHIFEIQKNPVKLERRTQIYKKTEKTCNFTGKMICYDTLRYNSTTQHIFWIFLIFFKYPLKPTNNRKRLQIYKKNWENPHNFTGKHIIRNISHPRCKKMSIF